MSILSPPPRHSLRQYAIFVVVDTGKGYLPLTVIYRLQLTPPTPYGVGGVRVAKLPVWFCFCLTSRFPLHL